MSSEPQDDVEPAEYDISNEDIVTQERLRQILNWHEKVVARDDEIEMAIARGEIPPEKGEEALKSVVSSYIRSLQTLITQRDDSEKWLSEYKLGEVTLPAPNPYRVAWEKREPKGRVGPSMIPDNPTEPPRNYQLVGDTDFEPEVVEVRGLLGFARLPTRVTRTYEINVKSVYEQQAETERHTVNKTIPRKISHRAFEVASFLAEDMGLDVDITDIDASMDV